MHTFYYLCAKEHLKYLSVSVGSLIKLVLRDLQIRVHVDE
jgi:hypothetical protein